MVEQVPAPSIIIGAAPPPGVTGIKRPFVLTPTPQPLQTLRDQLTLQLLQILRDQQTPQILPGLQTPRLLLLQKVHIFHLLLKRSLNRDLEIEINI